MPSGAVACIGRREVNLQSMRAYLEFLGAHYVERGFILSTGNAPGSDQLYALGAMMVDPTKVELYLPWKTFEKRAVIDGNKVWLADQAWEKHVELAASASPGWDYGIRETVKPLMIRNAMIIYRWAEPVDLVLAYPSYHKHGWSGTGHAMRVAASLGIPVWLVDRGCYWNPAEGMPQENR